MTTLGPVNHQDGLPCHEKGGGPRNPWSVSQQDESVCLISVHKRDAVLAEARIGQWIPSRSGLREGPLGILPVGPGVMRVPPRRGGEGGLSSLVAAITADRSGVGVQAFRQAIQVAGRSDGSKDQEIRGPSESVE